MNRQQAYHFARTQETMAVRFVGLKCPVCGKNLIKVRADRITNLRILALPPEQSSEAIASVKCPCHGGAVPITVVREG